MVRFMHFNGSFLLEVIERMLHLAVEIEMDLCTTLELFVIVGLHVCMHLGLLIPGGLVACTLSLL